MLRVSPHLYLQTLGAERTADAAPARVAFRTGVSGSLKHYFLTSSRTTFGMGQDAKLTLRPGKIFTLELAEDFQRDVDPFTEAADPDVVGGSDTDLSFARDRLNLGVRTQLQTPGEVFKVGLGYKFGIDHFEDDAFRTTQQFAFGERGYELGVLSQDRAVLGR